MIADVFLTMGLGGALIAMYLIFVVDAAVIPTLPEVFIVWFYSLHELFDVPPVLWAVALLVMALAGEATGNSLMYLAVNRALVRTGRMPRRLEALMRRWTNFLVLRDERIILLNRVIPVLPFVGAFIAALKWSYPRSLAYILIGAGVKYSALLLLVGLIGVAYDPALAGWITFGLVIGLVGVSAVGSVVFRKRATNPKAGP